MILMWQRWLCIRPNDFASEGVCLPIQINKNKTENILPFLFFLFKLYNLINVLLAKSKRLLNDELGLLRLLFTCSSLSQRSALISICVRSEEKQRSHQAAAKDPNC